MAVATAAVPSVVQQALRDARPMPGHVFSLYLPFWNKTDWKEYEHPELKEKAKLWALLASAGIEHEKRARIKRQEYVMQTPHPLGTMDQRLLASLLERQSVLADVADALCIEAHNLSPFVTGMGEEHAVENGFAFLNPYGVPYLAGSGVKGVIRRAAEELAAGLSPDGDFGWTHARVMWLFGYEDDGKKDEESGIRKLLEKERKKGGDSNEAQALLEKMQSPTFLDLEKGNSHFMGALSFWDVIIKGELGIDILTPHYGHYYQGDEPPHDAGQPVPNPFLVVAPGANFTFHITCAEHRLPDTLQGDAWRELIRAAFRHAFEWGGFGAKTAVGYGVLADAKDAQAQAEEARKQAEEEQRRIRPGDRVRDTETGEDGVVKAVNGDMALVDFYGEEYEVEVASLEKLQ